MTDSQPRYQAQRIRKGDSAAFRIFFHAHYPEAVGYAVKQVRDVSIAEDIVQDVMVRLWERRSDIDPSRSLRAYLFTLIRTSVVDHFRHEAVKRRHVEHEQQRPAESHDQSDPFLERDIERAVASLEEKQRTVFVLNRFGGLTYSEVADLLDVSVKTVEKHMSRALRALRTDLKDWLMVLLFAVLLSAWARPADGQTRREVVRMPVTLSVQDAPLSEVLARIAGRAGVGIVFDDALVAGIRVDLSCDPCRLGDAMDRILSPHDLGFNVTPGPVLAVVRDERFVLSGTVVDSETGETLPLAQVQFRETGDVADLDGAFSIPSVRGGMGLLVASYVGYQRLEQQVDPSEGAALGELALVPSRLDVGEITILSAPLLPASYGSEGARSTMSGVLQRLPSAGSGGTFSSMAILPGIDATEERAGDLFIRGSTPRSNLMTWDGIPIYRADHFFGMVSAFSPMAVDRVKLYDRGAPARYGGRVGPVVHVESPSALGRSAAVLHGSMLDAGSGFQASLGQRVGLWMSLRRSSPIIEQQTGYSAYFDEVIGQDFETDRPGFSFREASGRIDLLVSRRHHVAVSGMYSDDGLSRRIESDYQQIQVINVPGLEDNPGRGDDARDDNPTDRDDDNPGNGSGRDDDDDDDSPGNSAVRQVTVTELEELDMDWRQQGVALNWTSEWSTRSRTHLQVAVSSDDNAFARVLRESSPDSLLSEGFLITETTLDSRALRLRHDAENKVGRWEAGVFGEVYRVRDELRLPGGPGSSVAERDSSASSRRSMTGVHAAQQLTLGAATADLGLRVTATGGDHRLAFSPRAAFALPLGSSWKAHAAWGRYHQYLLRSMSSDILTEERDRWYLVSDDERSARSMQSSVGLSRRGQQWSLTIDGWQRMTKGVPVLPESGITRESGRLENDDSRALGAEISAQFRRERWLGWISYTRSSVMSRSELTESSARFDALHDRPHAFKAAVSADKAGWSLSLVGSWASGRPVGLLLSPAVFLSADGSSIRGSAASAMKDTRLPAYARMDARFGWSGRLGAVPISATINIINLTNHDNVRYRRLYTEGDTVHYRDVPMLGFTPGFYLRLGMN